MTPNLEQVNRAFALLKKVIPDVQRLSDDPTDSQGMLVTEITQLLQEVGELQAAHRERTKR